MLSIIILLSISHETHGENMSYIPPQGCSYDSRLDAWSCQFDLWTPPLKDEDFNPGPLQHLSLTNINGQIPGGVKLFSAVSAFCLSGIIFNLVVCVFDMHA